MRTADAPRARTCATERQAPRSEPAGVRGGATASDEREPCPATWPVWWWASSPVLVTCNLPQVRTGRQPQTDDGALAGSTAAVAFYANRDDRFVDNHQLWFVRSTDNGATCGGCHCERRHRHEVWPAQADALDRRCAVDYQRARGAGGPITAGPPRVRSPARVLRSRLRLRLSKLDARVPPEVCLRA